MGPPFKLNRTPYRILGRHMEPGWRFMHPFTAGILTVRTIRFDTEWQVLVETQEGLFVDFRMKEDAEVLLPGYLL